MRGEHPQTNSVDLQRTHALSLKPLRCAVLHESGTVIDAS
jgi:hypothetical protein